MARNDHAPRLFLRVGDRLAFNNGILVLGVAAMLILIAFGGSTLPLIPLFAVGVFLAFTLSQSGMVVRWWRTKAAHWRRSLVINAAGGLASGAVLVAAATTKFLEGAWVVVLLIPSLTIFMLRIKAHYRSYEEQTRVSGAGTRTERDIIPALPAPSTDRPLPSPSVPGAGSAHAADRFLAIVLVAQVDLPHLKALAFAVSLGHPTLALHICAAYEEAEEFQEAWQAWGDQVPLEVVVSPYRAVIGPAVHYVEALHDLHPDMTLTVVVPHLLVAQSWHRLLHGRQGARLRRALEVHEGVAVLEVPFHLAPDRTHPPDQSDRSDQPVPA